MNPSSLISIYINLGLIECKLENYYNALDYFGQAWEIIFNDNLHYHRIIEFYIIILVMFILNLVKLK